MYARRVCAAALGVVGLVPEGGGEHHDVGFSIGTKHVTLRVKRKHIGDPASFRWRAFYYENERLKDAAPDKGYKKHLF